VNDFMKLYTLAIEIMRSNAGNAKKAAPKLLSILLENAKRPLLIAMTEEYLGHLPAEATAAVKPDADAPVVSKPRSDVPASAPSPPVSTAPASATPKVDSPKSPVVVAPLAPTLPPQPAAPRPPVGPPKPPAPPAGRRREGKHRRVAVLKTPSAAARAGEIAASRTAAHAIFSRKIRGGRLLGDISMHELRAIAQNAANTMIDFLNRGYDDGVDAMTCQILSHHGVAADPFATLKSQQRHKPAQIEMEPRT
jgi:hypothetical protein